MIGGFSSTFSLQVCFCGSSGLWNIMLKVILAGIDVLVAHTIDTAEQISWPQDHVEPTCSQNNEGWHLASCKSSSWNVQD